MLSLTSISSSIMVSWSSPGELAADSYNVSYSCHNFCGSQQTSSDTVSGTATTHTISSLNAGSSSCTVSVTAVFGSSTSNTVTNSTNTASAGTTHTSDMSLARTYNFPLHGQPLLVLLKNLPTYQWRPGH